MKQSVKIILHTGFWLSYLLLIAFIAFATFRGGGIPFDDPPYYLWFAFGAGIVPPVIAFYLHYFYLFPTFLQRRKIGLSIIYSVGISAGAMLIGVLAIRLTNAEAYDCVMTGLPFSMSFMTGLSMAFGVVALVIKGFITWYEELKLKEELIDKTHRMELELVKSQLDPHFLFNTINNIDVLIMKDPEQASAYLNKLSDIMRFMLYETKNDEIPLAQELSYIEKYIELQRIRTANDRYVNYRVAGAAGDKRVAPMIFIPFIENAFKHSSNKKLDDAVNIEIAIDREIVFKCLNKFEKNGSPVNRQNGLGNELILKRLQLLYPDKHTLLVDRSDHHYSIELTIRNGQA